jgi:hypothetical protein
MLLLRADCAAPVCSRPDALRRGFDPGRLALRIGFGQLDAGAAIWLRGCGGTRVLRIARPVRRPP